MLIPHQTTRRRGAALCLVLLSGAQASPQSRRLPCLGAGAEQGWMQLGGDGRAVQRPRLPVHRQHLPFAPNEIFSP